MITSEDIATNLFNMIDRLKQENKEVDSMVIRVVNLEYHELQKSGLYGDNHG